MTEADEFSLKFTGLARNKEKPSQSNYDFESWCANNPVRKKSVAKKDGV